MEGKTIPTTVSPGFRNRSAEERILEGNDGEDETDSSTLTVEIAGTKYVCINILYHIPFLVGF